MQALILLALILPLLADLNGKYNFKAGVEIICSDSPNLQLGLVNEFCVRAVTLRHTLHNAE